MLYTKSLEDGWRLGNNWGNRGTSCMDSMITYGDAVSVRIDHVLYGDTSVYRSFNVDKNSFYKVSAMVKYDGYEVQPDNEGDIIGGAGIEVSVSSQYKRSKRVLSKIWTKIELIINSKEEKEINVFLRNGYNCAACKGTAWFSNVSVENLFSDVLFAPTISIPNINLLFIIIRNVDALVQKDGDAIRYKGSLNDADVKYLREVSSLIPESFRKISNNLFTVGALDVLEVNEPLSQLTKNDKYGYTIQPSDIKDILDEALTKNAYQQIIVTAPIRDIAINWLGLSNGFSYLHGTVAYAQVNFKSGGTYYLKEFPDAVYIHEIIHCIESRARIMAEIAIDAYGHDFRVKYGYDDGSNEWIEVYIAYMRNTLPDGRGLPREVYNLIAQKNNEVVDGWQSGYFWGFGFASYDDNVKYGDNGTIKIEHPFYTDTYVYKMFPAEKNTDYKISAVAKCDGYRLSPENNSVGGASISTIYPLDGEIRSSNRVVSNKWESVELVVHSKDKDKICVALRYGFYNGACKGTAWFSDVTIEKC